MENGLKTTVLVKCARVVDGDGVGPGHSSVVSVLVGGHDIRQGAVLRPEEVVGGAERARKGGVHGGVVCLLLVARQVAQRHPCTCTAGVICWFKGR
jgi:hypothetical protein